MKTPALGALADRRATAPIPRLGARSALLGAGPVVAGGSASITEITEEDRGHRVARTAEVSRVPAGRRAAASTAARDPAPAGTDDAPSAISFFLGGLCVESVAAPLPEPSPRRPEAPCPPLRPVPFSTFVLWLRGRRRWRVVVLACIARG